MGSFSLGRVLSDAATGGLNEVYRADTGSDIGTDIYNHVKSGVTVDRQPGVGGPANDQAHLQQDPTTGLWYDPTTGTSYPSDRYGLPDREHPIQDPNLAQRSATDAARAEALLAKMNGYGDREASTFRDEQLLASRLRDTIAGRTPSVAQNQLVQGLEAASNSQQSLAAGASGNNAALARMQAARNVGTEQMRTNQAQGLVRADETAKAQSNLGGLLKSMAGQSIDLYNTNLGGAGGFNQSGLDAQEKQQGFNTEADKSEADFWEKLASKAGDTLKTGGAA